MNTCGSHLKLSTFDSYFQKNLFVQSGQKFYHSLKQFHGDFFHREYFNFNFNAERVNIVAIWLKMEFLS